MPGTGSAPVGFIGLGMMGLPMARCLLRRGGSLVACDPSAAARAALAEGAAPGSLRFAGTPDEVAEGCEVVVAMLPDSRVVAQVMETKENVRVEAPLPEDMDALGPARWWSPN